MVNFLVDIVRRFVASWSFGLPRIAAEPACRIETPHGLEPGHRS
jgi:hypothetical protein